MKLAGTNVPQCVDLFCPKMLEKSPSEEWQLLAAQTKTWESKVMRPWPCATRWGMKFHDNLTIPFQLPCQCGFA